MTEESALYGHQRVVGVIQARVGSTRLPAKVLRLIAGRPMIVRIWERLCLARQPDDVLAAIPDTAENDTLAAVLQRERIPFVRGPEEALATRLFWASVDGPNVDKPPTAAIVRITGDEPLIDPHVIDHLVAEWRRDPEIDYVSNVYPASKRSCPEGLDVEVMRCSLLARLRKEGGEAETSPSEWLWAHPNAMRWSLVAFEPVDPGLPSLHWSVDTAEDLAGARVVYERLPEGFTMAEVLAEFGEVSLPEIGRKHQAATTELKELRGEVWASRALFRHRSQAQKKGQRADRDAP